MVHRDNHFVMNKMCTIEWKWSMDQLIEVKISTTKNHVNDIALSLHHRVRSKMARAPLNSKLFTVPRSLKKLRKPRWKNTFKPWIKRVQPSQFAQFIWQCMERRYSSHCYLSVHRLYRARSWTTCVRQSLLEICYYLWKSSKIETQGSSCLCWFTTLFIEDNFEQSDWYFVDNNAWVLDTIINNGGNAYTWKPVGVPLNACICIRIEELFEISNAEYGRDEKKRSVYVRDGQFPTSHGVFCCFLTKVSTKSIKFTPNNIGKSHQAPL